MRFDSDFIEKVSEANSLVDIISEYTILKAVGDRHTGLCPFPDHNEKTPSFSVSDSKQLYHCFGCRKSGNIYTFIKEMKGLNFPEAVEYLANRAHIPLPKTSYSQSHNREENKSKDMMKRINQFALRTYQNQLKKMPESHPVRQYCHKRGINEKIIDAFQLGWADEDWDTLAKVLREKDKNSLKPAEVLGLLRRRKDESHYDNFRSRLIFPILTTNDICVGFGGRVVGEGEPKYLNSPESPIFNKRKTLYGLPEAIKYIRQENAVILVEGYMDLIALFSRGLCNVVATLGTAFTEDHARVIKRYTKNVVVLFDGDRAGVAAAERSLPILLSQGLHGKGCFLPEGKDPDDFISSLGVEAMKKKIETSEDLFLHQINQKRKNFRGGPTELAAFVEEFAPLFAVIQDEVLKDLYLQEFAGRLNQSVPWLRSAIKKYTSKKSPKTFKGSSPSGMVQEGAKGEGSETEDAPQISLVNVPRVEIQFFNLCLSKEDFFQDMLKNEIYQQFLSQELRVVAKKAIEVYGQEPSKFARLGALLTSDVTPAEALTQYLARPMCDLNQDEAKQFFEDCKIKIRTKLLQKQTRDLSEKVRLSPPGDSENLERIMNMQKEKNELVSGKNSDEKHWSNQ